MSHVLLYISCLVYIGPEYNRDDWIVRDKFNLGLDFPNVSVSDHNYKFRYGS